MQPIDIALIVGSAVLVIGIVVYLIVQKKKGKTGCGCGCQGCPHAGVCGGGKDDKNSEEDTHV